MHWLGIAKVDRSSPSQGCELKLFTRRLLVWFELHSGELDSPDWCSGEHQMLWIPELKPTNLNFNGFQYCTSFDFLLFLNHPYVTYHSKKFCSIPLLSHLYLLFIWIHLSTGIGIFWMLQKRLERYSKLDILIVVCITLSGFNVSLVSHDLMHIY